MKRASIVIAVLAVLCVSGWWIHADNADELFKQAEEQFEKHNYRDAAKAYEAALKADPKFAQEAQAGYRLVACWTKLGEWKNAFESGERFVTAHKGTLHEALGLAELSQLYYIAPHYGYAKDTEVFRGNEPHAGYNYVNFYAEDAKKTLECGEQARALMLAFQAKPDALTDAQKKNLPAQIIENDFNLAQFLSMQGYYAPRPNPPAGPNGELPKDLTAEEKKFFEPAKEYTKDVDPRRKILFLYDEIMAQDKSEKQDDGAQALYRKALYLKQTYTPRTPADFDPVVLLTRVVEKYKNSESADVAQFALGLTLSEHGDFVAALKALEAFKPLFPNSRWTNEVASTIQSITYPQLNLSPLGPQLPGRKIQLQVYSRNIPDLKFTAYKVKLEDVIVDTQGRTQDGQDSFLYGLWRGDRATRFRGEKVKEWDFKTADQKDYKPVSGQSEFPIQELGAYLVEAEGTGYVARQLVVITDLAITRLDVHGTQQYFVADAISGKPVEAADLIVQESWWENVNQNNVWRHQQSKAKSGELGIYAYTPNGRNGTQVEVFAQVGNRYAATNMAWTYGRQNEISGQYHTYLTTDRPVYRPGQTVNFKASVRYYNNGEYAAPKQFPVLVVVQDAKGNKLYERELMLNDQGSVNDKLVLGAEPPLGMYQMYVTRKQRNDGNLYGQMAFRVEEYKKPEFEVTVTPAATQAKIGEKVTAKIQAKYYFGAPVAEATVSYRVFREAFWQQYTPPGRYDWLYGEGYGCCIYPMDEWGGRWRNYNQHYYNNSRELVLEKTQPIAADGTVDVEFETAELAKRFPDQDHHFSIEAEVVDKSRRTITGSGGITVTRSQFYVYLDQSYGFYRPGDKVKLELKALSPDGAPIQTKGTLLIQRVKYTGEKNDKIETADLAKRAVETDAAGLATIEETLDEAGQYKFSFETEDAWKTKVESSSFVWVRGEDFDARSYRFRDVELITDKRAYQEGETAHVMINANYAGAYVLLIQEVGNDVRKFELFHLDKKSKVLDIAVEKRNAPNFFLHAVMLHDGQLFRETREVFCPPEKNFLNLTVSASKPEFKPGEKGTFTFSAQDSAGKPVQAELAFTLFDASTLYFQKEMATEIKQFFFGQRRYQTLNLDSSHQVSFGSVIAASPKALEWKDLKGYPPDYQYSGRYRNLRNKDGEGGFGGGKGEMMDDAKAMNAMPAAPMAAEAPGAMNAEKADKQLARAQGGQQQEQEKKKGQAGALVEAEVRSNFADSVAWAPTLLTDADGKATLDVTFPDSLTTWKGGVYGMTKATQVASASANVITTKHLLVRLQAPRFFVERDEVTLSANIHNYLATAKKVHAVIELPQDTLACAEPLTVDVEIPAKGEKRLDWNVKVLREGRPKVTVKALTDEESDAMALDFPALVHGTEKFVAESGSYLPDQMGNREVSFNIPADRKPEATEFRVTLAPSLAGAMLDAMPYLIDYPYGCCEQTMSRFIPAVTVQATLKDMGLNLEDLAAKRKQLTPEEIQRKTGYLHSPVFDSSKLASIVQAGLQRVYTFQNGDGGFGWWANDHSNPNMTAYVLYGLSLAKKANVAGLDENARQRGLNFLKQCVAKLYNEKETDLNKAFTGHEQEMYASYVLALDKIKDDKALELLWEKRDSLNAYGKALMVLTMAELGDKRAQTAYENMLQFIQEDKETQTAWLKVPQDHYWYWYNNDIEANAYALKAVAKMEPKGALGSKLTKYLLNKRRGYYWQSTKDTATTIYGMADYMKASGEMNPEYTVTLNFDGIEKKINVTKDNFFTFDNQFVLKGTDIGEGAHKLSIKKDGPGALYYTAGVSFFTKEADIKGAGHEINVARKYFRLTPKQVVKKVTNARGEEVEIKELAYDKAELAMGEVVKSGEQIEVELTLKVPNDYEYVIVEDMKAAGCEPVDLVSGGRYEGICSNMELRDTKVVFFMSYLNQGEHILRYKLRAETPGTFHALPAKAQAMYAPDVKAISDEMRLGIKD